MSDERTIRREAPTRRDYMRYGGAVVAGGMLAGCTGGNNGSEATPDEPDTEADETENQSPQDESYEICMEPVDCIEFPDVPRTVAGYLPTYIDMSVALGHGDAVAGMGVKDQHPWHYYDELAAPTPSQEEITELPGELGKEIFYELSPDVLFIDPNYLVSGGFEWKPADVREIRENVAPFFGNYARRPRGDDWANWTTDGADYAFLSLYDLFGKIAEVFQERERFDAFSTLRTELRNRIQSRLPTESPSVGLVNAWSDIEGGEFWGPLHPDQPGWEMQPYRDLNVEDAFAGYESDSYSFDYETLLEYDPEVLVFVYASIKQKTPERFEKEVVEPLRNHDLGSQLRAVENERVAMGTSAFPGPITELFGREMLARRVYPGTFEAGEQLFDRQRVADIINGGI
ncbi:ABC transporter substrate-binding protein (plasmid) [Haloferacaceae archaeon DSL9]